MKILKVVVDELPKACDECQLCDNWYAISVIEEALERG